MEEKSNLAEVTEKENTAALDDGSAATEATAKEATDAAVPVTDASAAADEPVAEPKPEKKDVIARLRDADDTITRAASESEAFKRRRSETAAPELDGDKKREDEMKKLAEEEKKREEAAEEKRAAFEYAEGYRARVRRERESSAAKKREEEKERARAEEKAAREREIAEGIEREREEAKARGARMESLLEKVGTDVGAVAVPRDESDVASTAGSEVSADDFFGGEEKPDFTAPTSTEADAVSAPTPESPVAEAAPDMLTDTPTAESASTSESAPDDRAESAGATHTDDYVITIDGDDSDKDMLYIDGTLACEIPIGAATAAEGVAATGVSSVPSEPVTPRSTASYYADFPAPDDMTAAKDAPAPLTHDEDYEEEKDLLRFSEESAAKKKDAEEKDKIKEYPDPEPTPDRKKTRKEKKAEREAERRDMLDFERDSRSGKPFSELDKSDEERIVDDYEDVEAARREASSAEMGDGSRVPDSTVSLDAEHVFDKKALEKNKTRQIKNDTLLIEHRIYDEIRRLEMDTHSGKLSFTAKIESEKEKRSRGKKRTALEDTKKRLKDAKRFEDADNRRYYHLVMTDVEAVKLPASTDRDEVKATRNELLALLKKRDDLNLKLIELYSVSEGGKGKGAEGRFRAVLSAKKKAYKQQLPIYKKYEKAKISKEDKEKIYPLLDERTELYGELARVNYMLKKEKARGLARKELKRERTKLTRKLDENKRAIIHYERKALRKAEVEHEKNTAAIIGWAALALLVVGTVLVIWFWPQIQPWLMEKFGVIMQWAGSLIDKSAPKQ